MLKIYLKHFIYEKCIDVIFNAIINNFRTPNKLHNVKVGNCFYSITVYTQGRKTVYYSPEVVEVNNDYFVISGAMFTEFGAGYDKEDIEGSNYQSVIYPTDKISIEKYSIYDS